MKETRLSKRINSKNFSTKSIGYTAQEVDAYLDEITDEVLILERAIEEYTSQIRALEGKNAALEQKNRELSLELCTAKANQTVVTASNSNFSNMDLFNRIADLEKMVKKLLEKEGIK